MACSRLYFLLRLHFSRGLKIYRRNFLHGVAALASPALLLGCTQPASAAGVSRFFETSDGARLHYLEAGRGKTVVFVPGWCMPAFIWDQQITHVGARYRAIALDPRGQGRSQITRTGYEPARRGRDINDLLEALGRSEQVVLVGWSLGVLDVLSYLSEFGDRRVAGLVLVDNSIGEGDRPPSGGRPTFIPSLRRAREATVAGFVRSMYATSQSQTYLDSVTQAALRMPLDASISLLSYPRSREFWKQAVYSTRKPVLYAVRPRFVYQGELLVRNHPNATMDVYENAGHALFVDEAARFNASLDDFLIRKTEWR